MPCAPAVLLSLLQNVTLVAASSAAAHEAAFFGVPQQSLEEAGGKVRQSAHGYSTCFPSDPEPAAKTSCSVSYP
jgi:hypothetical protein